jgi:hypothetical protein
MKEMGDYSVDNIGLIKSDLAHLNFELERDDTNYFRVATESHNVLYRAMIQVLRGPTNFGLIVRKKHHNEKKTSKFQINLRPPVTLEKENLVPGCKKSW